MLCVLGNLAEVFALNLWSSWCRLMVTSFLVSNSGLEKGLKSSLRRHCRCAHRTSVPVQLFLWCSETRGLGEVAVSQETQILPGVLFRVEAFLHCQSHRIQLWSQILVFSSHYSSCQQLFHTQTKSIFQNLLKYSGYLLNASDSGRVFETCPMLPPWSVFLIQLPTEQTIKTQYCLRDKHYILSVLFLPVSPQI